MEAQANAQRAAGATPLRPPAQTTPQVTQLEASQMQNARLQQQLEAQSRVVTQAPAPVPVPNQQATGVATVPNQQATRVATQPTQARIQTQQRYNNTLDPNITRLNTPNTSFIKLDNISPTGAQLSTQAPNTPRVLTNTGPSRAPMGRMQVPGQSPTNLHTTSSPVSDSAASVLASQTPFLF